MEHFIANNNAKCPPGAETAALEDSIMRKGRPATAGSKILENFISPIEATVVTRLEDAGIKISGNAKMDEFGIAGLLGDPEETVSGAVSAVADGSASFGLCNDYTGAVRRLAAERGLCYIHPTYGTVSRYGLIHAVSSMDQIGIVCKTPADGFRALSVISGYDPNDGAMFPPQCCAEQEMSDAPSDSIRIAVPANSLAGTAAEIAVKEFTENLDYVDITPEYLDYCTPVMQILCCAELSSNMTRYDGIKFGYRADGYKDLRELYTKSRTEALGQDAKLAAITGAMVVSQGKYDMYYDKAMRIRRLIKESLKFDEYDVIIMPVTSTFTKAGETSRVEKTRCAETARCAGGLIPQLCGFPSVTIPFHGAGLTLIANAGREHTLMTALKEAGA